MRKCHLCGSLIRRRAEYCRYCTVRQPGAPITDSRHAADAVPPPGPPRGLPPRPSEATPVDTESLELAMQPVAATQVVEQAGPVHLDVAPAPRHVAPAPTTYEIDPPPGAAVVQLPEALLPSNDRRNAIDGADDAVAVGPVETVPQEDHPSRTAPDRSPARRRIGHRHAGERKDRGPTDLTTATNGHDRAAGNGSGNANGNGKAGASGDGHVHVNGNGHARANGQTNGNGKTAIDTVEPVHAGDEVDEPAPSKLGSNGVPRKRPHSADALRGFEHFPEATAAPKVRWG